MAKLYYRHGVMNSGKTIELLKVAYNYEEQGRQVIVMSSAIDHRSGEGKVVSRVESMERESVSVTPDDDVYDMVQSYNLDEELACVLVDECQFLTREQVYQYARVVDQLDIPVIAVGLKNDYDNHLFEGSEALLTIADKIEEMKTTCWFCNNKAIMNLRVNKHMEGQIAIGGNKDYKAVCRKHYMAMQDSYS